MDTHIQFSNINFFYFALLKTSPEAKLLIIQKPQAMSTAETTFLKFFLTRPFGLRIIQFSYRRMSMSSAFTADIKRPPNKLHPAAAKVSRETCPNLIGPDEMRRLLK